MSSFEYVMVLVSIVIGLAITHLLTAFATAVHRLRGHGEPIRLEPVYLLWSGYILIWLISFWWWEFRFQGLVEVWSFGLYLFVVTYAITLYMLASILVPREMDRVDDSYRFFMEGRKWFFGMHLLVVGMDVADSFLKGMEWGVRPILLFQFGVFIAASIAGLLSDRRAVQIVAAASCFTVQLIYMFQELGVLGAF